VTDSEAKIAALKKRRARGRERGQHRHRPAGPGKPARGEKKEAETINARYDDDKKSALRTEQEGKIAMKRAALLLAAGLALAPLAAERSPTGCTARTARNTTARACRPSAWACRSELLNAQGMRQAHGCGGMPRHWGGHALAVVFLAVLACSGRTALGGERREREAGGEQEGGTLHRYFPFLFSSQSASVVVVPCINGLGFLFLHREQAFWARRSMSMLPAFSARRRAAFLQRGDLRFAVRHLLPVAGERAPARFFDVLFAGVGGEQRTVAAALFLGNGLALLRATSSASFFARSSAVAWAETSSPPGPAR